MLMRELTFSPDIATASEERCEMCGQLKTEQSGHYDAQEAIRNIASVWVADPDAAGYLLAKIALPHWSVRQISAHAKISHARVGRAATNLKRAWPELADIANMFRGPHSSGPRSYFDSQGERRKREASAVKALGYEIKFPMLGKVVVTEHVVHRKRMEKRARELLNENHTA